MEVDAGVASDAENPGLEGPLGIVALELGEGAKHDFLCGLLGQFRLAKHSQAIAVDWRGVVVDNPASRGDVTRDG